MHAPITFTVPGAPVGKGRPLTIERLHELLSYSPETGIFIWKSSNRYRVAGAVAGTTCPRGYVSIGISGKIYKAHRLAWAYVFGTWPKGQIDHIDRDKSNNRIQNLRDVDQSTNQENRSVPRADNKLGHVGVSMWTDGRPGFKAQIKVKGKVLYIGTFPTAEAAETAYLEAKNMHHKGSAK